MIDRLQCSWWAELAYGEFRVGSQEGPRNICFRSRYVLTGEGSVIDMKAVGTSFLPITAKYIDDCVDGGKISVTCSKRGKSTHAPLNNSAGVMRGGHW